MRRKTEREILKKNFYNSITDEANHDLAYHFAFGKSYKFNGRNYLEKHYPYDVKDGKEVLNQVAEDFKNAGWNVNLQKAEIDNSYYLVIRLPKEGK